MEFAKPAMAEFTRADPGSAPDDLIRILVITSGGLALNLAEHKDDFVQSLHKA